MYIYTYMLDVPETADYQPIVNSKQRLHTAHDVFSVPVTVSPWPQNCREPRGDPEVMGYTNI